MISTSLRDSIRCRMKLEPMKPAPPVTKTFKMCLPSRAGCFSMKRVSIRVLCLAGWYSAPWHFVGAGFGDQIRGVKERFESPRVGPPTFQGAVAKGSFLQIHVVNVRNLQLVAPARLGVADLFENGGVVEVDTGDGEIRFWRFGLFFNAQDFSIGNLRAAESFRIGDFFQNDVRAFLLLFKGVLGFRDVVFNDVVAKNNANLLTFHEGLRQAKRIGDAAFALLIGVVDATKIEVLTVRKEAEKVTGVLPAGNDDDVSNTGVHQGLDGIENHRAVVHGEQMFIRHARERVKPRTFSACQDHTLHM